MLRLLRNWLSDNLGWNDETVRRARWERRSEEFMRSMIP